MVGVIIVTHGQFGKYLLEAAQTILGPQERCTHLAVEGSVDMSTLLSDLKNAVKKMETGDGVIVITSYSIHYTNLYDPAWISPFLTKIPSIACVPAAIT